jgi:hypothetical protein
MIYTGKVELSQEFMGWSDNTKILGSNEIIGVDLLRTRKTDEPLGYQITVNSKTAEVVFLELKDIDHALQVKNNN